MRLPVPKVPRLRVQKVSRLRVQQLLGHNRRYLEEQYKNGEIEEATYNSELESIGLVPADFADSIFEAYRACDEGTSVTIKDRTAAAMLSLPSSNSQLQRELKEDLKPLFIQQDGQLGPASIGIIVVGILLLAGGGVAAFWPQIQALLPSLPGIA